MGIEGANVGRSALLTDPELGEFDIEILRTVESALGLGPEAAAAWRAGNSTPMPDSPVSLPNTQRDLLIEYVNSVPPDGIS